MTEEYFEQRDNSMADEIRDEDDVELFSDQQHPILVPGGEIILIEFSDEGSQRWSS